MARVLTSDLGAIGEIKPSMLTEPQFQALHGDGWILADGRNVAGSKYNSITGFGNAPNPRGRALRGKDNGAGQNPDGDVALGTNQADQFDQHNHGGGNHTHNSANTYRPGDFASMVYPVGGQNGQFPQTFATGNPNSTVIANNGGNETRMRNTTVNFFIRIN